MAAKCFTCKVTDGQITDIIKGLDQVYLQYNSPYKRLLLVFKTGTK